MISLFSAKQPQKWTATILLSVLVASIFLFAHPNIVRAQEDSYYDGPSFQELFEKYSTQCAQAAVLEIVVSAVLSLIPTSVPVTDWGEKIIKLIKDCLINATKFALLELITGQTVGWSQKGYGGNPSFVQNVSQYLLGIADTVAGSYIERTTAGEFLCSPFRAQIQLALTQYYQQQSGRLFPYGQSSCTLTGIASNVDAFLAGDFYSGGWESWIEMSANPYNTPYGAYLETTAELDRQIAAQTGEAEKKLDFASGFLSKEVQTCYGIDELGYRQVIDPEDIGAGGDDFVEYECDPPQTVTPGDTIKTSLEKVFGTKLDTVVAADEINEIVSLVAVYLLSDILTKDSGLSGYDYEASFDEPLITIDDEGGGGGQCIPTNPVPGTPGSSITYSSSAVNDFFANNIPLPSGKHWGDYRHVVITFDLTVGPWNGPGLQYNAVWLNRGGDDWSGGSNRIIEVTAVRSGPNPEANTKLRAVTQLDSCTVDPSNQKSTSIVLEPGQTYTFEVDYEPGADRANVAVRRGGSQVASLSLQPTTDFISSTNSKNQTGFYLQLGAVGSAEANEGNTNGWRWGDITVQFEP